VAEQIEQKGQLMGPRAAKKTMLARQVLAELNAGGPRVEEDAAGDGRFGPHGGEMPGETEVEY